MGPVIETFLPDPTPAIGVAENIDPGPDSGLPAARIQRAVVPYSGAYSKNVMYGVRGKARLRWRPFIREESREKMRALILLLKPREQWPQRKTYIDIHVQKPHHKGDAINVLDLICDAVKRAIGIDDRWFAIRRLDWEIVKDNPTIHVQVIQYGDEVQKVCSGCGRIRDLSMFAARKTTSKHYSALPSGRRSSHGTYCRSCKPPSALKSGVTNFA